jgi:hypothetical protein
MKSFAIRLLMFVTLFGAVAVACKDKDAEKRIAELESRVQELSTSPSAVPNPTAQPAAPAQKPEGPLPAMAWEVTEHDFGTITEGDEVTKIYTFENAGEAPLIIENVRPSCGCTAPSWTKTPIPVGGTGTVEVKFNSKGKPNAQNKTVTVIANTWPQNTVLRFKAFVTPAGQAGAPVK